MPTVFVCKECKRAGRVVRYLRKETDATLERVGCQKVCKGPVAGLVVNGRMEWFGRLDRRELWRALGRLVTDGGRGKLSEALEECRAVKRSGRPPR